MSDIDNDDIRRIDGGLLLVFRELIRRRRTTAVAVHLGLSQSAVSHALGRLRDLFGDPLFLRRPHGLEPTNRALELAPRIEALIDMMGAAVRSDHGFDPARSGRTFNLAATEYGVGLIDGAFVTRFRNAAPNATFALQHMRGFAALDALRRGLIDAALGRFESLPTGFASQNLLEDRYCVVARRDHPTIHGSISLGRWMRTGHIFASAYSHDDEILGPAVGEDPMPTGRVVTTAVVPRWEMALELVAGSDSIATCPRRLAEQRAQALGLQVLDPPGFTQTWTLAAARRDEADPGLDWFCGLLKDAGSAL